MAKLKFKDENDNWILMEEVRNKVTTISSSSTDSQYPSAKAVFDYVGNIEAILDEIRGSGANEPDIQITTN